MPYYLHQNQKGKGQTFARGELNILGLAKCGREKLPLRGEVQL